MKAAQVSLTDSLEDYLETVLQLVSAQNFARVKDIAKARGVKAGSVSHALKRLAEMGLVNYVRREYVTLTPEGEEAARRVFARHRLLTRFFEDILQMPHEAADKEACAMEHGLSADGMDRLVRFFEFLGVCPNGPDTVERFHRCHIVHDDVEKSSACQHACAAKPQHAAAPWPATTSVYALQPGQWGTVVQVNARGAVRQRLLDMGVLPNARITMERVAPAGDPVWVTFSGTHLALRRQEAEAVRVTAEPLK